MGATNTCPFSGSGCDMSCPLALEKELHANNRTVEYRWVCAIAAIGNTLGENGFEAGYMSAFVAEVTS